MDLTPYDSGLHVIQQAQEAPLSLLEIPSARGRFRDVHRNGPVEWIQPHGALQRGIGFEALALDAQRYGKPVERVHHVGLPLQYLAQHDLGDGPVRLLLLLQREGTGRQRPRHAGFEPQGGIDGQVGAR